MSTVAQILDFKSPAKRPVCGENTNVAPKREYLSPDEARRVIDAAGRAGRQRDRDKLLLMLMFRHGLRVAEAIDLRWTDFDLDAPRDRPFYIRRLKGSKDGIHTLEPDTAQALKRMKATSDGVHVFRSERGGPLSHDIVRVICERAGRQAGFGFRVRPHMLRHAAGFALAEAGKEHGHLYRDLSASTCCRAGALACDLGQLVEQQNRDGWSGEGWPTENWVF